VQFAVAVRRSRGRPTRRESTTNPGLVRAAPRPPGRRGRSPRRSPFALPSDSERPPAPRADHATQRVALAPVQCHFGRTAGGQLGRPGGSRTVRSGRSLWPTPARSLWPIRGRSLSVTLEGTHTAVCDSAVRRSRAPQQKQADPTRIHHQPRSRPSGATAPGPARPKPAPFAVRTPLRLRATTSAPSGPRHAARRPGAVAVRRYAVRPCAAARGGRSPREPGKEAGLVRAAPRPPGSRGRNPCRSAVRTSARTPPTAERDERPTSPKGQPCPFGSPFAVRRSPSAVRVERPGPLTDAPSTSPPAAPGSCAGARGGRTVCSPAPSARRRRSPRRRDRGCTRC
jgi:hypothetical protein